ncbi:type II toxin-antitoxin system VapC family toxin [Nitrosomonas sp.]|uniref:type II toxin-antitoxin system VapC family toxin n=1 Tax=Nitrosomonas sp. TaxID=42353 RepID=UPI002088D895|nr:type II toxin-antitoxin system VapC family toxin [Nitrosomonas sp.]GJL76406.1 MAG: VapC ribonuclease [Nitrosomonas sp.]
MFLMDVNVLVYAHREDTPDHLAYREWLESIINGNAAYGYSELVLSGFLRVVTHPKVFEMPTALPSAIRFVNQIKASNHAVCLAPGPVHWKIFLRCIEQIDAKGNDVPDAYHAALAIEWNCIWVTTDKGFKRFKGLKVRHPLTLADS